MVQTVFYPALNDFCRKYLIVNPPIPLTIEDKINFPYAIKKQQDDLFEQFLLFDRLSFKVYGENICATMLLRLLGLSGMEALIEQNAISFDLWTPTIAYHVTDIPGLDPLTSGNLSSPAHQDPEKSVELGLSWLEKPIPRWKRRPLVKKLVGLYNVPGKELPHDVAKTMKSAYNTGRLSPYGLDPKQKPYNELVLQERKTLAKCADDLLEYKYLIQRGMTSFSEYKYFSPFWDTVEKFRNAEQIKLGFSEIARIEGFPNVAAIAGAIDDPLKKLPKLRQTSNATRFRRWLNDNAGASVEDGFAKIYVDSIAERKGLFDSAPAKFGKAVAMTALGSGIGAAAAGPYGAALGGLLGHVVSEGAIEVAGHLGLDMLDSFVWERITKGWTPRMFFNEINRIKRS